MNWIGAVSPERVVYEATGAYHGAMGRFLSEQLPLVKVNPLQAKRFAQSQGTRAKTDKADAKMLAQMGAALGLEPDRPQEKDHHIIRELQTTRTGLVKAKVQARNQLAQQTLPLTQGLTRTRIRQIEGQIKKVDAEINARLAASPKRKQALEIIKSIPGLGNVVATAFRVKPETLGSRLEVCK